MAKLKIGKLPVYKGEYQDDVNYSRLNLVSYLGTTFQSLTDDNIGHPPAELSEDGGETTFINTNYWNIIAKGSEYNNNRVATDSNKGYKILKRSKSFAEQVTEENTIYEIRYDFDLNGKEIIIPNGCVLKFEGGSFANGIIVGQNTEIETCICTIFKNDITLSGTWNVYEAYSEWFDEPTYIGATKALDYFRSLYFVPNKSYNIEGTITVNNSNTVVSSKGKSTLVYTLADGALFYFNNDIRYFSISNLTLVANSSASNNTAYCFKSNQGHAQSRYSNLLIQNFKYGFYNESHPIWDMNYSSIRCSYNYIAFYNNASSSINLCFETFYFDQMIDGGTCFYTERTEGVLFLSCNFGGDWSRATKFIDTGVNTRQIKCIRCNFEGGKFNSIATAGIKAGQGSDIELDSCNIISMKGEETRYFFSIGVAAEMFISKTNFSGNTNMNYATFANESKLSMDSFSYIKRNNANIDRRVTTTELIIDNIGYGSQQNMETLAQRATTESNIKLAENHLFYNTDYGLLYMWKNNAFMCVEPKYSRGTFANKPKNPKQGDMYFCTDLTSPESMIPGFTMVFDKTTGWRDSLGRQVLENYPAKYKGIYNNRPGSQYTDNPHIPFYDTTNDRYIFWTGTRYVDSQGADVQVYHNGKFSYAPKNANTIYEGFMFMINDDNANPQIHMPIFAHIVTGENPSIQWYKADGTLYTE